jgi:nucleotide-binding universal stress UspA family protein
MGVFSPVPMRSISAPVDLPSCTGPTVTPSRPGCSGSPVYFQDSDLVVTKIATQLDQGRPAACDLCYDLSICTRVGCDGQHRIGEPLVAAPGLCEDRLVETARFELGSDGPARILVGVDGTHTSLRAGAYAAGLARRQGAKLIVLYVKTTPATSIGVPELGAAVDQAHDEIAAELRQQLVQQAPRLGLDAELLVREGNPYAELLRVAEERKVDAIVVGASTQAGHRLVGSLATRLVRHATWPVTVVP